MNGLQLIATGGALPGRTITNDALSRMVDTSDAWITSRTGIRTRHWCTEDESAATLAIAAARQALDRSGLAPADIACCVCATLSAPDATPSVACQVQAALGLPENRPALDINAACSGFLYGMAVVRGMLTTLGGQYALVIGCEALSRLMDPTDRSTCVLFGDGSGAVVLSASGEENAGILGNVLGADGSDTAMLCMPAGGSAMPPSERTVREGLHYLKMDGREVFKHAVRIMQEKALEVLDLCGVSAEDVALLIPHQANTRIIETVAKRLKIPSEKVYVNIENYGNTSSASIPIALDEVVRGGKVKKGDLVLLVAFGAGLTWGATLIRF